MKSHNGKVMLIVQESFATNHWKFKFSTWQNMADLRIVAKKWLVSRYKHQLYSPKIRQRLSHTIE